MADIKVPMRLVIREANRVVTSRLTGQQERVRQRVEMQNDAEVWLGILGSVDVGDKKYRGNRRAVRELCEALDPMAVFCEGVDAPGIHEVGDLVVSQDRLDLMKRLCEEPPEGVQLRGAAVRTIDDFLDLAKTQEDKPTESMSEKKLE